MLNNVALTGRLVRDPELRYTPSGTAVTTLTLAVNRPWVNKDGDREADFIQIVVFNKPAENVANFTKKGHLVAVEGRLQTRSYEKEDPAGNYMVYVTEVVANSVHFLESKKEEEKAADKPKGRGGSRRG